MHKYKLYEIKIINNIPMWEYKMDINANNIVEAEYKSEIYRMNGYEYIIVMFK